MKSATDLTAERVKHLEEAQFYHEQGCFSMWEECMARVKEIDVELEGMKKEEGKEEARSK